MKILKTTKNIRWSLVIVPVISVFSFVTIITAAPASITSNMNNQEIETIAVVSADAARNVPAPPSTISPQTSSVPVVAAPSPKPTTPAPAKANNASPSVKQPSRSTNTSTAPKNTTTAQPASKAAAIITTGKQYLGVKYVYGGTTPSGFDCSGFVQYIFAKNGVNLPRVSRDQFKVGTPVSFNNLQPGDLVFFSLAKNGVVDHEGIYIGNGQFLNAASSKGVTIYDLGPYWKSAYIGAKRVL